MTRIARPLAALLLLTACAAPPAPPAGLVPAPVPPPRPREPLVDVTHYDIRVDIDHRAGVVDGSLAVTFRALDRPATRVELDAVELVVAGAWDGEGDELAWELRDHVLTIALDEPLPPGAEGVVSVDWRCWPRRGLYFVGPSASEPDRPWHVWTQGQTHEARHWLPVVDRPDERATHLLQVTVDGAFTTMAAGERLDSDLDPRTGRRTDTWALELPHPAYLITLVAGELGAGELPSASWPLPVLADARDLGTAQASLAPTDDMLALLSTWTGRPYPYPKYAQCLVRDFVAGGQENISATTLMHETLHAAQDGPQETWRTDDLVMHEAAHMWFGDLLTCREWDHLWLNEGFATWAELLWARETRGPDEARAMALGWQRAMVEAEREAQLPVAWSDWPEPDALFDVHRYEGAATRLHLLEETLGAEAFRRGVQLYVRRHAAGSVVTDDLRAALEEGSGRELATFFEEWVTGTGYPVLEARVEGPPEAPRLSLLQVQGDGGLRPVFHATLHVAWSRGGIEREVPLELSARRHELDLAGAGALDWFRVDSRTALPGVVVAHQPEAAWRAQLTAARDGVTRLLAAQWFGRDPHVPAPAPAGAPQATSLRALEAAARGDAFQAVRVEALRALARRAPRDDPDAVRTLLDLSTDPDPRVRAAAAEGLGLQGGDALLPRLLELSEDPNATVSATAFDALVGRGLPGAFTLGQRLLRQAGPLRWRLREDLLGSLARLQDDPRVGPLLVSAARGDPTARVRAAAVHLLRGRADPPADVRFRLAGELLWDPSYWVRAAAAESLGDWPDGLAVPLLRARQAIEIDPDVSRAIASALQRTDGG